MTPRSNGRSVRIPAGVWSALLTALIGGGAGLGVSKATSSDSGGAAAADVAVLRADVATRATKADVEILRAEVRETRAKTDGIDKALDHLTLAVRDLAQEVHNK